MRIKITEQGSSHTRGRRGEENLVRCVPAGEIIKPWLILGPFYEDLSDRVQGLTLFERPGATVGRATMAEIVEEAKEVLATAPCEGEEAEFRGQAARWELVRRPEKYLSWGTYHISNHLAAAFLSTIVIPEEPGERKWRLVTGISLRAVVAINGEIIYDTEGHPVEREYGIFEYRFSAALRPGENVVTLGLFRLGRMAQVGCRLEADTAVEARIPLAEGMSLEERARIEEEVGSLRLKRDLFYPEHDVGILLTKTPSAAASLKVQLLTADGDPVRGMRVQLRPTGGAMVAESKAEEGKVILCPAAELEDGHYQLLCRWEDAHARPITEVRYEIMKLEPTPPLIGYDHLPERRRLVLEHFATHAEGTRRTIWAQVARYALGRYDEIEEEAIRETCQFIAARKDCSDFIIQGLLRLMYWEREAPKLSPEIRALMKDTVLGFKYWVDEPGDTVMYMGSENHRLLFHVAEWLAGQLFPTEEFTNSHQRGLYHATKGRMYITEWLRQRGRFGFDEWHSNSYYPVNIAPLINIYDFAIREDYKLRQMARAVLDYMFFNLAADTFHGVFGTTHGRSYGVNIKYPDCEGTAATCWLLYGEGSLWGGSGMAAVSVASSSYELPQIFARIAEDHSTVVESRQRQGLLPGSEQSAHFIVYRTPDYMLSGLQDHRKGEIEPSTHVAQVTLEDKAVIFWSCPLTCGEGSGLRPDYWSGHICLPRVIQYRNVLALTWRLSEYAWMTHCFFEPDRFDEVRFHNDWAFARKNRAYVGIYSQHGMVVGDYGQYAGRELICYAPQNTWIVECGRQADWGSFDNFVAALRAAAIEERDGALIYHSPSIGRFVTGWDVEPKVGGVPIQTRGYPLVDSPWAHADFGSGEMMIRYGEERLELWFNQ